jgi:hypothetical protein
MNRSRNKDSPGGKRITVAQARNGERGYVIMCVSLYAEDVILLDHLVKARGGGDRAPNASRVVREALQALKKEPTRAAD